MREILFRGKPLINPKLDFVYGSLSIFKDCYSIKENKEFTIPTPINSETLGQFTDLYDKNGKKIFEGDIVKLPLSEKNCKVTFKSGCFVAEYGSYGLTVNNSLYGGNLEVIGNIYDNPEEYKTNF